MMLHKVMKLNMNKISFVQNLYQIPTCNCATFKIKNELISFFQHNLGMY